MAAECCSSCEYQRTVGYPSTSWASCCHSLRPAPQFLLYFASLYVMSCVSDVNTQNIKSVDVNNMTSNGQLDNRLWKLIEKYIQETAHFCIKSSLVSSSAFANSLRVTRPVVEQSSVCPRCRFCYTCNELANGEDDVLSSAIPVLPFLVSVIA